jgi:membrane-associated protein
MNSLATAPMLLGIQWMDPNWLLSQFGSEFFWVSLLIVFVECGLFFPFLPGDTLLFAMGLFIATDKIDVFPGGKWVELLLALLLMIVAAVAGNVVGYEIGRKIGEPLREHDGRILKRTYLEQTSVFFDKHGNMALVLGRFVPFVRTYVTLVAGVTRLPRRRFWLWSLVGAVLWVSVVMLAGFFLGSAFPTLGQNIDKAMLVILAFSVIPVAYEWWRHRHSSSHDDGPGPDGAASTESSVEADRA